VIRFTVVGGATVDSSSKDPPLGTLRGRVLQAGHVVAGAWVVAARPGATKWAPTAGTGEPICARRTVSRRTAGHRRQVTRSREPRGSEAERQPDVQPVRVDA
jgi:hypothetical protein